MPQVPQPARRVAQAIALAGGRAWLVGGWVRDQLLGRPGMDLDLEVGGLDAEAIDLALSSLGPVMRVGRAFPVFKLQLDGCALDISQPRSDSLPGGQARVDPELSIAQSAARRDLRINAIALDPLSEEIQDPFDGRSDLKNRILRAVDEHHFLDDPLRVLRVARFVAQLDFTVDEALIALGSQADWRDVASERLGIELCKLLRAPFAPEGIEAAARMKVWQHILPPPHLASPTPELSALRRLTEFEHGLGSDNRALAVALAILLHRIPKEELETAMDRLDVHRREGLDLRREIITALSIYPALIRDCSKSTLMRAADNGELAIALGLARALHPSPELTGAMELARELGILHAPVLPLLMGRDLIELGVEPGAMLGELLKTIRDAQLDGRIKTPEEARSLVTNLLTRTTY